MSRKSLKGLDWWGDHAVAAVTSVILAACGGGGDAAADTKVCYVTDTGGIDDKTFNETSWNGVVRAQEELGIEGKFLESQQQTDYERNINAFIEDDCNCII